MVGIPEEIKAQSQEITTQVIELLKTPIKEYLAAKDALAELNKRQQSGGTGKVYDAAQPTTREIAEATTRLQAAEKVLRGLVEAKNG